MLKVGKGLALAAVAAGYATVVIAGGFVLARLLGVTEEWSVYIAPAAVLGIAEMAAGRFGYFYLEDIENTRNEKRGKTYREMLIRTYKQ